MAEILRERQALEATLRWSRGEEYLEHTKHDALASPLLSRVFGFSRYSRIFATQAVMRFPLNLRPLLGVPKTHNPKGLALFIVALLDAATVTGGEHHLDEARRLIERLLALRSPGAWHGSCWGYQYPWQDLGFFAPAATPNAVVTAFVCEAFLRAYEATRDQELLDTVESACGFFMNDLTVLKNTPEELCLAYMPLPMSMRVMDVSILIASVLARLHSFRPSPERAQMAKRLCQYVVNRQTADGAWFYTDPPEDSPVKIDNYHTGFILDALLRCSRALETQAWDENYRRGTDFYAHNLFNPDGAPRWMSHQDFPHDIHGAAQGILTFSEPLNLQRYPGLADRISSWALDHMYAPEGRFYYQQTRFYTKKVTFMRWCNAWMCRALAQSLKNRQS